MHMAWVKVVAGRLKSDFQYSGTMVYNTFPWPDEVTEKQKNKVRDAANAVLNQRTEMGWPVGIPAQAQLARLCGTLATFRPLAMPAKLAKSHQALDRVVDRCYRSEAFPSDRHRVEYLFALYEKITAPLLVAAKPKRNGR